MKPLKVYLRIFGNADCGVGYYRQWLPLMTAHVNGEVELRCQHFTYGEGQGEGVGRDIPVSEAQLTENALWADIVVYSRNDVPDTLAQMLYIQDMLKKPVVLDYDDLVDHTRPHNPGYRSFHPNSPHIKFNKQALMYINGLFVSTPFLEKWYDEEKKKITNPNYDLGYKTYHYPNSLNFKERDKNFTRKLDKIKKKKDEIRIGWSGSASHYENLQIVLPALKRVMQENKNVTFYYTGLFGDLFNDFKKGLTDRIKTVPFVGLKEYHKSLLEADYDLVIAPLTDCNFNRAKSNLRVLEYGSCKLPVVCSPIEPYKEFKEGKEVLFAQEENEWYEQINKLIKNPNLREDLGVNLYKKAKMCYNVDKNYKTMIKGLRDIVKKFNK